MASDFTPNSIKTSGGGGGIEGGMVPIPPSPIIPDKDKIVVEDIYLDEPHTVTEMKDVSEEPIESILEEVFPVVEDIEKVADETEEMATLAEQEQIIELPLVTDEESEIILPVEQPDITELNTSFVDEDTSNSIIQGEIEMQEENEPILPHEEQEQRDIKIELTEVEQPKEEVLVLDTIQEEQLPSDVVEAEDRILKRLKNVSVAQSESAAPPPQKKRKKYSEQPQEYTNVFSKVWNGFFDLFEFKSHREKAFTKSFVSVAIMISLISMFHVQGLFALVNPFWLSWVVAFAIEIAVIVSLFSLKMLDRVSSWMIWTLIFILFFLQAVGNTFSAFIALDMSNGLISQLVDMINVVGVAKDSIWLKRVIAFMIGGVLPLLAFLFIKSISEYLDNSDEEEEYLEDEE